MEMDPIVLGENYILPGNDVGTKRPNDCTLAVGSSGVGKTNSIIWPTIFRQDKMNPVISCAKPEEGYEMAVYLEKAKQYPSDILDIGYPEHGTCSFDPLGYIESFEDISSLASAIVLAVLRKTNDDYWNRGAINLLEGLIAATMMVRKNPGMYDVLQLFDQTVVEESGNGIRTKADKVFDKIQMSLSDNEDNFAVRKYRSWHNLPHKTASCIRDCLSEALEAVFPEAIRQMMRDKHQIDFERLGGSEKYAVIVISDSMEPWQEAYMNLFFRTCIKQLLRIARNSPGNHLIRPVRLYMDDFSCSARLEGFSESISLFRSAGISALILLQGQSQLEHMYGADEAAIIRANCPVQVYFPGGMDIKSAQSVSVQTNMPLEDILFQDLGRVIISQSGKKPGIYSRFDTFHSEEYREFQTIIHEEAKRKKGKDR